MIHEYALDPELLKAWAANDRDYREFFREYGLGTPRLSSSFPRQKQSKYRSFYLGKSPRDAQSLQARRYEAMVEHLADALVYRDGFECTSNDWCDNVQAEDTRLPFHGVLASNPLDSPRSLTSATMYSDGSLWYHPRQRLVARTYESCSPVLRDMLRLAKDKILIVDPYGWNQRAIEFIGRLINDAFNGRVHSTVPELILCYKSKRDGGSPEAGYVKIQIEKLIERQLPGLKLKVYALDNRDGHDVFHNRYLLTELGGVSLGHGVDLSGHEAHTDDMTLLERNVYDEKWRRFVYMTDFTILSQA
ncbi:hypothetical protein [Aeromonas veronii]|uniref:hypothetical protein n=1 Tax=Aeromonas veronii TaxID=654 RepID=UPI0022474D99|nr:hypothetical protein [Aeromonas veronii]MCX0435723.1 hypothetical protein [Aeromonas veronii]